ncbi:MAG TPA: TIGR03668 family PPOX class F420-dependent oxidoreductase [Dermatophilaceae bacterium]|nr:TIGR03668 family PPOX class F420-dependent oxidoreductase [Dermatophilaceae bacterium]
MDLIEARRRFTSGRVGRLATVTAQGWPHLVPVVFALVDDVAYTAVDRKPKTTTALQRLANIAATGRASLLVDEYLDDWSGLWWVRFDGTAQVLAPDSGEVGVAIGALTLKYPQYLGEPPTGPVIALRLTRWRSWEAKPAS